MLRFQEKIRTYCLFFEALKFFLATLFFFCSAFLFGDALALGLLFGQLALKFLLRLALLFGDSCSRK